MNSNAAVELVPQAALRRVTELDRPGIARIEDMTEDDPTSGGFR